MLCRKDPHVVFITNVLEQKINPGVKFRSSGELILQSFKNELQRFFFHTYNQP